jgi:hypothetical protein
VRTFVCVLDVCACVDLVWMCGCLISGAAPVRACSCDEIPCHAVFTAIIWLLYSFFFFYSLLASNTLLTLFFTHSSVFSASVCACFDAHVFWLCV